jgi:hypothetical protein
VKVILKSVLIVSKMELETNDIFTLESVPTPEGVTLSKIGIAFYYGFKESVVNISLALKSASKKNMIALPVSLALSVSRSEDANLSLVDLPYCTFLNISRIRKDVYDIIKGYIDIYIHEHNLIKECVEYEIWNKQTKSVTTKGVQLFIMMQPLVVDFIWEQPEFNHLDLIVYPVLDGVVKSSRATLFRSKNIIQNEYNTPDIEIISHSDKIVLLPDLVNI